jgi:3-oxo-5-alpha-steroid 4-dehydrogenase 1
LSPAEQQVFRYLIGLSLLAAAVVFVTLFRVSAPYGRHARPGWGPTISNRVGWILMEVPASLGFLAFFLLGRPEVGVVWVFLALWQIHYVYRGFIFPFRLRTSGKRTPLLIVGMGIGFNLLNGYLNGRYLGVSGELYTREWLSDPRFLVGVALFTLGLGINLRADRTLFRLRAGGDGGYRIPNGGLYRWISCPNYFGEIMEWCGWALATWSLPGLVFAIWTAANLLPRAGMHHRWYRHEFADYPADRRAVVPFVY